MFIAVGTPSLAEVGSADMRFVHDAARAIADVIEDFVVVMVKSTVPIGAGDEVERIIAGRVPRDRSRSCPIPNSCARARQSRTSKSPIAW